MKHLIILCATISGISFAGKTFPNRMPDDFHIFLHFNMGFDGYEKTLEIDKRYCSEIDNLVYGDLHPSYPVKEHALEKLYVALKKLGAFTLKSDKEDAYENKGISINYTINGESYFVINDNMNPIQRKDEAAFNASVQLINDFVQECKNNNRIKTVNRLT